MRTFVLLAALAATALPAAAHAQSRDIRNDRAELREQQRELDRAYRYGDRRDVRDARRDVRDARRDLRQSQRDYRRDEWRGWRNQNRALYQRGRWASPYSYRVIRPGFTVPRGYYQSRYVVNDPWRYRLPRAQGNLRWVRFHDDVLLINTRNGRVHDVIRNFYW